MLDKNGVEITAGAIVEISGAYFKNDNGLYFVEAVPDNPHWWGRDCCLKKISKAGKISKAKYSTCFWPICTFVSSKAKGAAARKWNREHAQIEVKSIKNMSEVAGYFTERADEMDAQIRRASWDYGEEDERTKNLVTTQTFFKAVAKAVLS